MTFFWIYEVAFPVGFGVVGALCIAFALTGMFIKRPLVYSSRIPLFSTFAVMTPLFLISLRHIIAPPFFDGYGIYLNSVLVVIYPVLAYYALLFSRGYTILGLKPAQVRDVIRGHGSIRVAGFGCLAMSLVIPAKELEKNITRERLAEILEVASPPRLGFRTALFVPTLVIGLVLSWGAYWSWCEATRCSVQVNAFSEFLMSIRRSL